MQTNVRTPMEIFSMPQHLRVPVFQRRYVWDAEAQWEPLWRDITRVAEQRLAGTAAQHFLGAMVTQSSLAGMGAIASHAIIDGQQRLTTLQLVLDAVAAELERCGLDPLTAQLTHLTHNDTAYELEESGPLKLQHENDDRAPFVAVMTARPPIDYEQLPPGRVREAHQYFAEQAREWLGEEPPTERARALVSALTQGLQIVVISLTEGEPSQEIFETLNARGTPLTAADLIKNYVFQQIAAVGGDTRRAFTDQWAALEKPFWTHEIRVGRYHLERLSLFLNHWLVAKTGEEVSTRSTFTRFKAWFEQSGLEMADVLASLRRQADLYAAWIGAARTIDGDLSAVPLFVYRTEAADIEAVKPLLLWLYDVDRQLPAEVADRALRDLESWVMRRALLRRPASEYSRAVATLIGELQGVPGSNVDTALRVQLQRLNRPGNYWPGDREVTAELARAPIYNQPRARVRAYLEAVEDYLRGYSSDRPRSEARVRRDRLTIEHLLPRAWRPGWPVADLAAELDRDAHVHRLGNLTLITQALNSAVSNGPWLGAKGKRAALDASATLLMTRGPRACEVWDEAAIDQRTQALTDALLTIWPAPAGHDPEPIKRSEDTITTEVTIKELVAAGRLPAGTVLVGEQGGSGRHEAVVTREGLLWLADTEFEYPSTAAKSVLGRAVNGWSFWRLPDGRPLGDLRGTPQRAGASEPERVEELCSLEGGSRLLAALGEALRRLLPDWLSEGGQTWALSALPSTESPAGQRRLFTCSVGVLELFYAIEVRDDEGSQRIWVLNLDERASRALGTPDAPSDEVFVLRPGQYRAAADIVRLVVDEADVGGVLADEDVIVAARALAVRLYPSGRTPFGRFHSGLLTEVALAAATPAAPSW